MTDTLILVLLIATAVLGALAALTTVGVRGDGGPDPRPTPRRTRPEDVYLPYLLTRDLYHR